MLGHSGSVRSTRPRADTPADPPVRTTVDILLLESTVIWAGATALLGDEGRLAYGDLLVRAQNLATLLRRRGMRHGDLVGVVGTRSFSTICSIIGILLAGGVYVPFDVHALTPERLGRQLRASAVDLLLADRSDPAANRLHWAERVTVLDSSIVEREFMPMFRDIRLAHRLPEDPAVVLFNEQERGVLVTHAGIVRLVTSGSLVEFRSTDTTLLHAGAQHHAFLLELWGPLLAGGTVALAPHPAEGETLSPQDYARLLRRYRVTTLCAPAASVADLNSKVHGPLEHLEQVVVDLAGMNPAELDRLRANESTAAGPRIIGALGAAETTSYAVGVSLTGEATPVKGSSVLVANAAHHETAIGRLGALTVTGDALAIGYLGEPQETMNAFREVQLLSDQRLRGFSLAIEAVQLSDGRLLIGAPARTAAEETIVLSEPEVPKIRPGRRISPGEFEVMMTAHSLVRECVALADPHGEGVSCVFVTLKTGADPRAEAVLRDFLEQRVPQEQHPAALMLVARFPLDAQGRPDRWTLRQQCDVIMRRFAPGSVPPPAGSGGSSVTESRPGPQPEHPQRPEDAVRSIWQRLLHRLQVEPDEDFFASGGTSVQRIRLYAELNQRFPGAFTMAELHSLRTMRQVIEHLGSDVARERMLSRRGA